MSTGLSIFFGFIFFGLLIFLIIFLKRYKITRQIRKNEKSRIREERIRISVRDKEIKENDLIRKEEEETIRRQERIRIEENSKIEKN